MNVKFIKLTNKANENDEKLLDDYYITFDELIEKGIMRM
jgi:hypothetical protein